VRSILGHDSLHYVLKQLVKGIIIHPRFQGDIQRISLAIILTILIEPTRTGKEILPILMKGNGHNPIRQIKGLLNPIPMMHINININNSRINQQQLKYSQHNVINIAKATSLALLSMMQSTTKVNGNVGLAI
jgi:hypothetical protein